MSNDGNVVANSIEAETTTDTTGNGTFGMLAEPLEKVSWVASVSTRLAPSNPRGERVRFVQFQTCHARRGAVGWDGIVGAGSAPRCYWTAQMHHTHGTTR